MVTGATKWEVVETGISVETHQTIAMDELRSSGPMASGLSLDPNDAGAGGSSAVAVEPRPEQERERRQGGTLAFKQEEGRVSDHRES